MTILTRRKTLALSTTVALALALLAGCATPPQAQPLAEMTARTPALSTLQRLLNESGLAETLRGPGPYTLFAPSDEAFKALPAKTLAELSTDKARLKAVLDHHLVAARLNAADIRPGSAKSLQGGTLALGKAGDFVTVDDALVVQPDLAATNGVIHIVDRVLLPPKR